MASPSRRQTTFPLWDGEKVEYIQLPPGQTIPDQWGVTNVSGYDINAPVETIPTFFLRSFLVSDKTLDVSEVIYAYVKHDIKPDTFIPELRKIWSKMMLNSTDILVLPQIPAGTS